MQRTLVFILIAAVMLLSPAKSLAQGVSDAELAAKIDAIAARTLQGPNVVGLSIAVGRGDQVVFSKGFGKADLEFGVPVDKDTMFRIGSVTKQFSAAAVMKLVEQGKLSLDDTLGTLMPEFPEACHKITLRQLLNHTSGMWSYTSDGKFMTRDASLELTPTEMIALFKDHALDFEPGTGWSYSNSAYYLIGEIVAKASGVPYPKFLQDEFFTPLGLTRTRYDSNREVIANRAQGYSYEGGTMMNDRAIGADVPGAAGSLISNAEGLVRWNIALAGGRAVSAESYAVMTTPVILPDGRDAKYGLGLGIDTWEGRNRFSHGGGIFGFASDLEYLADDALTVAVISNCDGFSPGKLALEIARAALGLPEFVVQDLPVPEHEMQRFAGDYQFETIPLAISFVERGGHLWGRATGQGENRLKYQGNGEFRFEFDDQVKVVFEQGEGPAETLVLTQGVEVVARRKK